ncbi:DEAD/DEAH box helicase [Cytophagales bacterium LB-30]|uniref:DEAD/DEAH box helicase n=1 Tax=Shiella aurantiaca TaxID=3058365 RepID=A0ABT8F6D3_9BACT|nr:DEAD/DEAH box helicase [Shiella aurantiaca]MDN4165992.1 DEAD/DEAH box helicase [Shiella aurantiaca]
MSETPTTFQDFALNKQLWQAIEEAGYTAPSPVQAKAIPLVLAGHDVLGIAPTGTGKTAAYALPLLMKIKYAKGEHVRAVVLAPTRELVMQIHKEMLRFAQFTDLRIQAIYGGLGPKTQIENIQKGVDILVSTPGRFLEIYQKGELVTKHINTLVLDEADKMMDMGFMHQIRSILEVIPVKRQNLLFSATFPEKVDRLSAEFLEFPVRAEVAPQATTASTIAQKVYEVPNFLTKINLLGHLLQNQTDMERVIVFTRTKANADNISKFLDRKIIPGQVRVIHANKGQNSRINAMEEFKSGNIKVLVATDVAARGIDVSMVSHVINFDVPIIYEDYVHRIGRTGRAEHEGVAITFMTQVEAYHMAKIEKIIRMNIPTQPIPAGVKVEDTPFDEHQLMAREIDLLKRKDDPTFKGAFHEKKELKKSTFKSPQKGKKRPTNSKNRKK